MALENKNTIEPVSEQDISDALVFVETRFTYLYLDQNSVIYKDQKQFWEDWQDIQRQHIENGDFIAIRNLAGQYREYQKLHEQRHLRELGHSAIESPLAA